MAKGAELILDEAAFTADINPTDLPAGPIDSLMIGILGQTTAAASITGVTLLKTISLLRIFSDGLKTELSGADLLALNCLYLGNIPNKVNSGAVATNPAVMEGLILPLNLPAAKKGQIQVVYVAQTNVGSGKLAIFASHLERLAGPLIGIQRKPMTPTVTAAYGNKLDLSMEGAKLLALLIYSTTIPITTSVNTSAHKIRIKAKGVAQLEFNWHSLGPQSEMKTGDSDIDGEIDNYRLIKFDEPLPADDVKADVFADDTNLVVLIPVYQFG